MSIIKLKLPMPKIQVSDTSNKGGAPLLVLSIQGGSLKKGRQQCIYAVVPLKPKKVKFLKKLVKLSYAVAEEGECGEPALIEVREWSLIWDQETALKIDKTYFYVLGDLIWVEGYDSKGGRLGQTVSIDIRELKGLADSPIIWHDTEESNSIINSEFGNSFAKESAKRLKKFGIGIPTSLKVESSSERLSDFEAFLEFEA